MSRLRQFQALPSPSNISCPRVGYNRSARGWGVVKDNFTCQFCFHSRPQRPRSFWSAPRIKTSGLVQRDSGSDWLCKHNRMRPQPIRFVRPGSELAQSDAKWCWKRPEVVILGADQKERGLWEQECSVLTYDDYDYLGRTLMILMSKIKITSHSM